MDHFRPTDRILDVGCGDGFITAHLAQNVTRGQVVGIDHAQELISTAKLNYSDHKNLRFEVCDLTQMTLTDKFDWLVAFNSLHWIHDEGLLNFFKSTHQLLYPHGTFLFSLGLRHEPIWSIVEQIMHEPKWRSYFIGFKPPRAFYTKALFSKLLDQGQLRARALDVKCQTYHFIHQNQFEEYIISGMGQVQRIPSQLQKQFIRNISDEYLKACPPDLEGNISITFNNLEGAVQRE
jgi:trans-aconitate 2-methyltransferase